MGTLKLDDVSQLQVCSIELFRWKKMLFRVCSCNLGFGLESYTVWVAQLEKAAHFLETVSCNNACSVNFYVTRFGTNSRREQHMPDISVKPVPLGKADVTLHEFVIILDWVSCVYPGMSLWYIFES